MDFLKEIQGKQIHDPLHSPKTNKPERRLLVLGPLIVGAGPSGLAAAACLKQKGIPALILERSNCIASLWQLKTYDRLRLHLPKKFCQLPLMDFPANFPTYPSKEQFISYLESYVNRFDLKPIFTTNVISAEFDRRSGFWRILTVGAKSEKTEYVCQWLIVATGENADEVFPMIDGMEEFGGPIVHTSMYKSGELFDGKRVLVVGCGNSGMEVCLDLCNFNASPSLVVRDSVHVLPQEMLGRSTFGLCMCLLKWFPISFVDKFLLIMSRFMIGNTESIGLNRPKLGPLQLKNMSGKTPVLDVGTLAKIKSGNIKVFRGIKRLTRETAEFVDGKVDKFDAIILATGYKINVPFWLKERDLFREKQGFQERWKGENGLYAIGFSKRGLLGASIDATKIAADIDHQWKAKATHFMAFTCASPL